MESRKMVLKNLLESESEVVQSCPTLCHPIDCNLPGSSVHGDPPSRNTGVGFHALLQGIFPAQGLNPGLPHCRQILYLLSHLGSPREILYPTNLPSPAVSTYWPSGVHLHLYLYQCFIATILIHILIISYLDNYHCLLNDLSAVVITWIQPFW